MKALWLREVQLIPLREDFLRWWQFISDAEQKLHVIRSRHEELLAQVTLMEFRAELTQKKAIDTLYQAGEYEDLAAQLEAEESEIENRSYEAVGNFETQRIAVSDLFSRMGAVEHLYLNIQSEVRALKVALESAQDPERREDLGRSLKRKDADLSRAEREVREWAAVYERENNRKIKLWEEVERMWARSLDVGLGAAERRMKSRRARQEAELHFKESEKHKQKAEALRLEAEETSRMRDELVRAITDHRVGARQLFGCVAGEDFLYWPQRENNKEVYCIPISDQPSGYNLELHAKTVYQTSRQRGVEFIETLHVGGTTSDETDRRIDDFFSRQKKESASDHKGS